jgi:ABC-type glycerol-3-phosphate transport system substrate-binding protein
MTKRQLPYVAISRRQAMQYGGAAGFVAAVAPQIMIRTARGADPKKVLFVSEESNPKAQAVYDGINADFTAETGIEVVMEYPGFTNIAQRVATLIAAGTPPEIVWFGAGQAMDLALADQLADVGDVVDEFAIPDNLRMVVDGANRSVPTSQQFTYGWYRSDLYDADGLQPYDSWESYLEVVKALNDPPRIYGNIVPSTNLGSSHLLLDTMFRKNDVHWFAYNNNQYEVALDQGENLARAVETLEFLHEAHQYSPEASTYNWGELMSEFYTEKVANSFYVGARLLEQVMANNPGIADATKPISLPKRLTDQYYLSIQGFHINKNSNVDGAKQYVRFFLQHPAYIDWLHAVPMHIIPAQREVLLSEAYQANDVIQKRMDVLEFLDSIWGKGVPTYYADGPELNPYVGLFENESLGGWMLAERNIRGRPAEEIVVEAAETIREKKADVEQRRG